MTPVKNIIDDFFTEGNGLAEFARRFLFVLFLFRNFILKFVLFFLSYVVPKSRNILFFSSVGRYKFPLWKDEKSYQFKESPKYLAIYGAKKLRDFIVVFHIPNREMFERIEKLGIRPTKGLRAFCYMLRARCIFVDNNSFFLPNASFLIGRFKIIQCWHGTPLKHMGLSRSSTLIERIVERYKSLERRKYHSFISVCQLGVDVFKGFYPKSRMLILGYPRNDILFDREFFSTENPSGLFEFKKFSKVLLYAPTFRRFGGEVNPFDSQFFERLNEVLSEKNYFLLVKQHPYAKVVEFNRAYSNIKDVSSFVEDIQELLVDTDVLISDYSSIIFDFALTERLQLFYPFDLGDYRKNRGEFYFEYNEANLPGLIITHQEDFIGKLNRLDELLSDQKIKNRIREFQNKYNRYPDGNSCRRIFGYLGLAGQE